MNTILSQYLMRSIIASSALVMVVLLALAGLFEFIAQLEDVQNEYEAPQAILYTALRLPNLAFEMMPVSVLIGSLLGLGAIAANSEIIVMRSAGLSVSRLAAMVGITGFGLVVFTGLIGEFIGPPLDLYARNMRAEARSGQDDEQLGTSTWVRDGNSYLNLQRVGREFQFDSFYVYRFSEANALESIARADSATIDRNDRWQLEDFHETRFSDAGVSVDEADVTIEDFDVDAELLGRALAKPSSLSLRGLRGYIDYLRRNALDARAFETELWYRVSRTFSVMVMPVLALAFVFGSLRSGSTGGRLLIGVIIGLSYYLASEMLANSGQVFDLEPALVSWLPSIILVAVTMAALGRIR